MTTQEPSRTPTGAKHAPDLQAERRIAQLDRDDARADRERAAAHLARVYRDDLTGALTRRPGRECLEREISRAHEARAPLTLAYADVDGLKRVNDQHGHASGDRLLHAVGAALINNLRPYDIVIRYGGDEFVCALIDSSRDKAEGSMQRVKAQLLRNDPLAALSIGYAELQEGDTLDRLLERADDDMYQGRRSKPGHTLRPAESLPTLTCLHCKQPMDLQGDPTSNVPQRSYTATCPTCRRGVRVTLADTVSLFTADQTVAPEITLADRT